MAEPTLTLTYTALRKQVGFHLGFRRGTGDATNPAWTADQIETIQDVIDSGCRAVYNESGYQWAWLTPRATLTVPADATAVNLPDDFGSLASEVSVGNGSDSYTNWTLTVSNPADVLFDQQYKPDQTGRPRSVAVSPLKTVTAGQRWELLVFPKPDAEYTLRYSYRILPGALSGSDLYHRGGEPLSGVILAACLAECEMRIDRNGPGPFAAAYAAKLAAAIRMDQANRPVDMGMNTDPGLRRRRHWSERPDMTDPEYVPL